MKYDSTSDSLPYALLTQSRQTNGGTIVESLSDQATNLHIIDPTNSFHALSNSFHWKLIDESIKEGYLAELQDYSVRSTAGLSLRKMAVHSSAPVKRTRTPFSDEDDRILKDWVLSQKALGRPTEGNQIYKELYCSVSARLVAVNRSG